jgi:hypothetical protein
MTDQPPGLAGRAVAFNAKVDAIEGSVEAELATLRVERDELRRQLLEHAETCQEGPWPATSLRARVATLHKALHGLVSNRFNEDAAEIEALYDAAHDALRGVPNAGTTPPPDPLARLRARVEAIDTTPEPGGIYAGESAAPYTRALRDHILDMIDEERVSPRQEAAR